MGTVTISRGQAALGAWVVMVTACGSHGASVTPAPRVRDLGGLYWGRLAEVPDGMRVQVWLDADGTRVRGAYSAMPWNGEIEGRVTAPDALTVTLLERGVTRAIGSRTREVVLHRDGHTGSLTGALPDGERVDLARAGFGATTLRPGAWLSRWTGLPFGMAVETRLSHDPDGHWRAVYQYQGTGGLRDGSFDGTTDAQGVLSIAWQEVAHDGQVARGRARLTPSAFGLRGTYGIEGSAEGVGEWALEPLGS